MNTKIKTHGLYCMDIHPSPISALIHAEIRCTADNHAMGIAISPKEARKASKALAFYADRLEGKK